jgi:DNA-binding NtrC family response regulator
MPKMDGLQVLQRAKVIAPDVAVILITGYATVDSAVEAMKSGAYDYITKPFSPAKIESVIGNAIARVPDRIVEGTARYGVRDADVFSPEHSIITAEPQMLDILDKVKRIAQTDSTVLIQGESGTGKELIARAIHRYSRRSGGPYVAFNCAAMPETLVENELFGHEKGVYTGAIARQAGKLEQAHGGTILFDEVSEMAKPVQAKLLRAIQEREVVRLGGSASVKVDIRIVATTNKELAAEVNEGNFREDLFFRLCVVPIILPPLRERKDDIPLLARYFTQRFCARIGEKPKTLSARAIEALREHPWPGNIRELENTIERAVALSQKRIISPGELSFGGRKGPSKYISIETGTTLKEAEWEIIRRTLECVDGNKQRAADILGITSKTIRSKQRQYGYDGLLLSENVTE